MGDLASVLRLARGDDHEPETAPDPEPAVLPVLRGTQVSLGDQAKAAAAVALASARRHVAEMSRREGGVVNGLLNAKPPSVQEQCDYAKSRAWVPAAHDGGIAETLGVAYHALIGRPGVALGNLIAGISARPLRFLIAAFLVAVIAVTFVIWLA